MVDVGNLDIFKGLWFGSSKSDYSSEFPITSSNHIYSQPKISPQFPFDMPSTTKKNGKDEVQSDVPSVPRLTRVPKLLRLLNFAIKLLDKSKMVSDGGCQQRFVHDENLTSK
jgi:hypothetical protein